MQYEQSLNGRIGEFGNRNRNKFYILQKKDENGEWSKNQEFNSLQSLVKLLNKTYDLNMNYDVARYHLNKYDVFLFGIEEENSHRIYVTY